MTEAIEEERASWSKEERERKYGHLCANYPRAMVTGLWYMPEHFTLKPAHWHKTTVEAYESGLNCAIAGWRGGAKSTLAQTYQFDKMLHCEWRGSIHICRNEDLVKFHAGRGIHQLETNKRLQRRFNIHPGKRQEQDWFEVKIGKAHQETLTFVWITRDGSPRGQRLNAALIDDADDRKDSSYMRQKYFQDIHTTTLGALEPFEGVPEQIIASGNLTGENAIMLQFAQVAAEEPDLWVVRFIPAIEEGETIEWTDTAPGHSTWPERRSIEWLRAMRAKMNAAAPFAFEAEFQNRLVSMEDRIWSEEMFDKKYSQLPPEHLRVNRIYIDSAQKVTETGDQTAIWKYSKCIDGPDKGKYYRRECRMGHMLPDEIANEVIRMYVGDGSARKPECDFVKLETKTADGEDPLAAFIRLRGRQENVNIAVAALVPSKHGDKRTRSYAAVKVGRAGALYSPEVETPDMQKSKNQMISFTGKTEMHMHAVDDGHDAEVWAMIDLQAVEDREEDSDWEPMDKIRNRVRAA